MKKGDYVYTPRFCSVKIARVFESRREAMEAGFREPTHYEASDYGVLGRSIDMYHMEFAAYKR